MAEENSAAQRQTALTADLKSKQLLLFVFARRSVCQYSMAEENSAARRQAAVIADLKSKQLLLFVFVLQYIGLILECRPTNHSRKHKVSLNIMLFPSVIEVYATI